MKKPRGFFSKMAQGAKHALGFENKDDRKALESLERALAGSAKYGWVTNIREIQPGVIVAWVTDNALTIDTNTPEILYKGKELDLHNLQDEADFLYGTLSRMKSDLDFKDVREPFLKNQIDSDSISH
jgi:hypothetical protein